MADAAANRDGQAEVLAFASEAWPVDGAGEDEELAGDWDLIARQYDEMVKFTTALRERTAEPETIVRRFTRSNVKHPTYKALAELTPLVTRLVNPYGVFELDMSQ